MSDDQLNSYEVTTVSQPLDDRTQAVGLVDSGATQYSMNLECPVCHTQNSGSERYCTDCGFLLTESPAEVSEAQIEQPPAKLVSADRVREFPLRLGANTVGRADSDVLLTDNSVSRRHAVITVEDGRVYLEDVGSTNGTNAGGVRIEQGSRVELQDGADVVFGSESLKLVVIATVQESVGESASDDLSATADSPEMSLTDTDSSVATQEADASGIVDETGAQTQDQRALYVLVSRDGSLRYDLLKGTLRLGRRTVENDIVISDQYCSGKHAELEVTEDSVTVRDIGSTNGTLINAVKIAPNAAVPLNPGDEVTFGQTPLILEAIRDEFV